jgi:metal-responsive CopG/Arc/MetJ family transcriptional regulator
MGKTKRLEFDFSKEAIKRLDQLAEKADCGTRAELLRKALSFYEKHIYQLEQDDKYKIIKMKTQISQLKEEICYLRGNK